MDAGLSLRRARRRAGLTQRALARATGVAQPTIARIERGLEEPRVATLTRLLAACGHRMEVHPSGGEGVDRTAIRELLALTPAERLDLAVADARALADVPAGALAGEGRPPVPTSALANDPIRGLRVLTDHRVDFVVVGPLAARLWGSPTVTNDLDVCPAWDEENLEHLASALVELEARLRGEPDDVVFLLDAQTLANGQNFTFTTIAGGVAVSAAPAGGFDYATLREATRSFDLGDLTVEVVDLDDLIAMKRAAGRPKDRIEVEVLEAVRDERER